MTRDLSSSSPEANLSDSSLQLAYQRLLALERFKSGFLARTSHELRSPVNTIVSLHQLILEDLCEGPEEEKEFIGQSKEAALKMLALFDQITAVSKLDIGREPPKLEAIDLSFLLPEVEMLTTLQAANQNVRYAVDSPTDELEINSDPKWLKNLLVSLIQDAIPHGKILRLAVETFPQKTAIVIECDRTADQLQSELDNIANAVDLPPAPASVPASVLKADGIPNSDSIQLSTGLILATAHTALPLINGQFSIDPHPETAERSCLTCSFLSA
ncbi:MAG: HAMP domain-containing sensor histidine kinase [Cyanobacteria bacterium P01_F01_bin.53]